MRQPRLRGDKDHFVHAISRIVNRRFIFEDSEKEHFCQLVRLGQGGKRRFVGLFDEISRGSSGFWTDMPMDRLVIHGDRQGIQSGVKYQRALIIKENYVIPKPGVKNGDRQANWEQQLNINYL